MSRRIEGEELENIQFAIVEAKNAATTSGCQRDHRGAGIFKDGRVLGAAANGPFSEYVCQLDKCGNVCGIYAMHAERLCIIMALDNEENVQGASVLHVRVNELGEIEVSGDLRCEDCTGFMRRVGRNKLRQELHEFILLQAGGWIAYTIEEADQITRANLRLD